MKASVLLFLTSDDCNWKLVFFTEQFPKYAFSEEKMLALQSMQLEDPTKRKVPLPHGEHIALPATAAYSCTAHD